MTKTKRMILPHARVDRPLRRLKSEWWARGASWTWSLLVIRVQQRVRPTRSGSVHRKAKAPIVVYVMGPDSGTRPRQPAEHRAG